MPVKIEDKDLAYTTREVADLLRVTTKAVTRWCREGKIGPDEYFRTPGNQIRIRKTAVDRMMAPSD